ncbi:MAG: beta-L-arabinofuranosidase domain-containing protein, partial [Bacteroidota bacterium]
LYNGFLSGVSLEGDRFFSINPLEADGEFAFHVSQTKTRTPWFSTPCSPANVMRFLPSLPGYVYAKRQKEILVNLFLPSRARLPIAGQLVEIEQTTEYPWDGRTLVTISPERADSFRVSLRLPSWTDNRAFPTDLYRFQSITNRKLSFRVNGELVYPELKNGFASVSRHWKPGDEVELVMPLPIRKVLSHEAVEENQGKVALSRGPIVFCVEGQDVVGDLTSFEIPRFGSLQTEFDPEQLGGIQVIRGTTTDGRSFQAIPYYAWSHRGEGSMKVWLPVKEGAANE